MSQLSSFFALGGGLDQVTQAIAVPPGRVIACRNHEVLINGYGRVAGYERFDGRTSPTTAGSLIQNDPAAARAARDAARALITAVPGAGAVRGVVRFNGSTYAWRDKADSSACGFYRSTTSGWVEVALGWQLPYTSGGAYEIKVGDTITAATGGGTAIVQRIIKKSGTWGAGDAGGYMVLSSVTGTFTPGNLNVGANSNVATFAAAPVAQKFPLGGRYWTIAYNFFGGTSTRALYGCNGVGHGFEFDGTTLTFIETGSTPDTPIYVGQHHKNLFFAFRGGSVQASDTGNPLSWTGVGGAFEVGMGDEVTGLISNNTDSLVVLCASSASVITGSYPGNYAVATLSDEAGAIPYTAQRIGSAIYMDNRGMRSIAATQAYGNFKLGSLTTQIQAFLDVKKARNIQPVASVIVRSKDHYRLFYSDGSGFSLYMGRKNPEAMLFDLGKTVTCISSTEDSDNRERIFFGSLDGFVYEMESGTSFDGAPIEGFIMLPFNHEGSPRQLKRWLKASIEMVAQFNTQIGITNAFDYAGGEQGSGPIAWMDVHGGGGFWNIANYNEFYWSTPVEGLAEAYLEGVGRNMAVTIACNADDQDPYVLQGVTLVYSVRGAIR